MKYYLIKTSKNEKTIDISETPIDEYKKALGYIQVGIIESDMPRMELWEGMTFEVRADLQIANSKLEFIKNIV